MRALFVACQTLILVACASNKQVNPIELNVEAEQLMAREAKPEIRRDYPALQDEQIQTYISLLGQRIVKANGLDHNPYEYSFVVVDVPLVNAFALPAGSIYVTKPLLKFVKTEAELAGVLSHEMAHVQERHASQKIVAQRESQENSWMYGMGGAIVGGISGLAASEIICPGAGCGAQFAGLGAVAGVKGGLLVQKYLFLRAARRDELTADLLGYRIAVTAGYAGVPAGEFYSRQKTDGLTDSLNTHPRGEERISQIKKLIEENPNAKGIVSSKEFASMKQRLEALD